MRPTKRIRNVAFLGLLLTMLWAGPVNLRADYIDPPDGDAWCPESSAIVAQYQGTYLYDPYPTCDICCGEWISAEEWCQERDGGDYVVNNPPAYSTCTCCVYLPR